MFNTRLFYKHKFVRKQFGCSAGKKQMTFTFISRNMCMKGARSDITY